MTLHNRIRITNSNLLPFLLTRLLLLATATALGYEHDLRSAIFDTTNSSNDAVLETGRTSRLGREGIRSPPFRPQLSHTGRGLKQIALSVEFGLYNFTSTPWRITSFPDPAAKWIWSRPRTDGAPVRILVTFTRDIYLTTDMTAIMYYVVDDFAAVSVNGFRIGSTNVYVSGQNYSSMLLPLRQGINIVRLRCQNTFSYAGVLLTIIGMDGAVLARSDSSWGWQEETRPSGYYLGCYGDFPRTMTRAIDTGFTSVNDCVNYALASGKLYVGLQNGGECWTTNDLAVAKSRGAIESCNMLCIGNTSQICGGLYANSIYEVAGDFPPAPSPYPSPSPPTPGYRPLSVELGLYNYTSNPWRITVFPDPAAKWIWSRTTGKNIGDTTQAVDLLVTFTRDIYVATDMTVIMHYVVDDFVVVSVNGFRIGSTNYELGQNYSSMLLPFEKGINTVRLRCQNRFGFAGVLLTVIGMDGAMLARSDSSWGWQEETRSSGYYLGCYGDFPQTMTRAIGTALTSVNDCVNYAIMSGQWYVGLQNGSECWTTNDLTVAKSRGAIESCNMPCIGNTSQICGGLYANSIYEVAGDFPSAPSPYPSPSPPTPGYRPLSVEIYNFTSNPWGITIFPDTAAKWIWSRPGRNGGFTQPTNLLVTFTRDIYVATEMTVIMHYVIDDFAAVSVNGFRIGSTIFYHGGWPYSSMLLPLKKGINTVRLRCQNTVGWAGVLLTVIGMDGAVLARSDSSWGWQEESRTTGYYLGCYGDFPPTMTRATDTGLANVNDCINYALASGKVYVGLQNGVECWTTNDLTVAKSRGAIESCNMSCIGNTSQICGGVLANSIYEVAGDFPPAAPELPQLPPSGYQPSVELALFNMPLWGITSFPDPAAKWIWSRNGTIDLIVVFVRDIYMETDMTVNMYATVDTYAVVSVNSTRVGDILYTSGPYRYSKLTIMLKQGINTVRLRCQQTRSTAGVLLTIMNESGAVLARSDSSWGWQEEDRATGHYMGCYEDRPHNTMDELLMNDTSVTVDICINKALIKGHLFVGLQNGGLCYATNFVTSLLRVSNSCNEPCIGNTSQICGGLWSNSVYEVAGEPSREMPPPSLPPPLILPSSPPPSPTTQLTFTPATDNVLNDASVAPAPPPAPDAYPSPTRPPSGYRWMPPPPLSSPAERSLNPIIYVNNAKSAAMIGAPAITFGMIVLIVMFVVKPQPKLWALVLTATLDLVTDAYYLLCKGFTNSVIRWVCVATLFLQVVPFIWFDILSAVRAFGRPASKAWDVGRGTLTKTWCLVNVEAKSLFKLAVFCLSKLPWLFLLILLGLCAVPMCLLGVLVITALTFLGMILVMTKLYAVENVRDWWSKLWPPSSTAMHAAPALAAAAGSSNSKLHKDRSLIQRLILYEVVFESIPSLVAQIYNNHVQGWNFIAIASLAVSLYLTVDTFYQVVYHMIKNKKFSLANVPLDEGIVAQTFEWIHKQLPVHVQQCFHAGTGT